MGVDLPGDVSLQAADDLGLGLPFAGAALDVGAGGRVRAHTGEHDPPQGVVGLAVAAGVEPVAGDFPRRGGDRGGGAQVRPGGLGAESPGVVPGGDEQQRGGVGTDPVQGEQARGAGSDKGDDELVQALELAVQELSASSQLAQRDADGIARDVAGAGPSDAMPATRAAGVCRVKRARRSSGPVRSRALAWLIARVRSPVALRLATISARIASTSPSRPFGAPRARPDWAARAALTASRGSDLPCRRRSWRSERSTSTTRTPAVATCRDRPAP